jgi:hypothetical protein
MYYSSGNYEAFARPRKPAGVENKTAWFVGSGLAALAGAAFLNAGAAGWVRKFQVVVNWAEVSQIRAVPSRGEAVTMRAPSGEKAALSTQSS